MNVIIAYLETMFAAFPQTPRLAEAKAELQTMMEDAYAAFIAEGLSENEAVGRVIAEFGNLDELAPVLGITAEVAPAIASIGGSLPGSDSSAAAAPPQAQAPAFPLITREEVEGYAAARREGDSRLALGVSLCVVAPGLLIAVSALSGAGVLTLGGNLGAFIGIIGMLVLIAGGVLLFVRRGQALEPYSRISEGRFTRSPAVERWARELAGEHAPKRTRRLQIAIVLWVLAAVPVLATSLLPGISERDSGAWGAVGVAGTLVMVATGLLVFLPSNWANDTAELIAKGGKAGSGEPEEEHSLIGVVASIYWPLVTAVFLAWSFIGDAWDRSWIIWPICGVLFAAIAGGIGALEGYRKSRRRQ